MDPLPLVIFLVTYLGLAAGKLPFLGLDRTGFAVLGGLAMVALTPLTLEKAQSSIHGETIAVLFGLMMLSAQFRLSGLYGWIATRFITDAPANRLLLLIMLVSAGLSAVLTNDVVCFAMAPLICGALLRRGRNPLPYLIALACASNIGSALTPIGNPQNIYIAQRMGLPFGAFVAACAVPVILSLAVCWLMIRRSLQRFTPQTTDPTAELPPDAEPRPFDRPQAIKSILLAIAAICLFLTSIPPAYTALGIAGIVLLSRRMRSQDMLALVDWQLLALFVGIFVVSAGLAQSGWTSQAASWLADTGIQLHHPAILTPIVALLSNLVSNVPAVVMLEPFLPVDPATGHLLALASTFAGNAVIVGSIANIIVAQQAKKFGLDFGFIDHLKLGLPIALSSLALVMFWGWLIS